jgi:hypothetical protein
VIDVFEPATLPPNLRRLSSGAQEWSIEDATDCAFLKRALRACAIALDSVRLNPHCQRCEQHS